MGLLYDVNYPHTRAMDLAVPWSYLELVARDKKNSGATAVCVDGQTAKFTLVNGQWLETPMRPGPSYCGH